MGYKSQPEMKFRKVIPQMLRGQRTILWDGAMPTTLTWTGNLTKISLLSNVFNQLVTKLLQGLPRLGQDCLWRRHRQQPSDEGIFLKIFSEKQKIKLRKPSWSTGSSPRLSPWSKLFSKLLLWWVIFHLGSCLPEKYRNAESTYVLGFRPFPQ